MEDLVVDSEFWRGKRVLLTGHTGFKGSWMTLWLGRLGAVVHGYALPPVTPSLYGQIGLEGEIHSTFADVRDARAVSDAIRLADPEIVFHLAAQPLVRASYALPVETFAVNVMGTAHVLEAARTAPRLRSVVVVTTDKVYENHEWEWRYREADRLGGHDPYSASKACAEMVCQSWQRSFVDSLPWALATARAGNVIGGGDWADDRLIPDMIRAAAAGRPASIRNPLSIRPWQHVLDPVAGYLRLAERLWQNGEPAEAAWNFGPDASSELPVHTVADLVCREWGDGCGWVQDSGSQPHESRALSLDSTRARVGLDWHPRLSLEDAVRWTVSWYRAVADGASARALTLEQISSYENLATP